MTEPPRRWGKAGKRLTAQQARPLSIRNHQTRAEREADNQEAYRRWKRGLLVPARITSALDANGLVGPEIDEACKAVEPEVDQWEEGILYPRWDQVEALAMVTGVRPKLLTETPRFHIPIAATSMRFHLKLGESLDEPDPIYRFRQEAIDARMDGTPSPLIPQKDGQLELWASEPPE